MRTHKICIVAKTTKIIKDILNYHLSNPHIRTYYAYLLCVVLWHVAGLYCMILDSFWSAAG